MKENRNAKVILPPKAAAALQGAIGKLRAETPAQLLDLDQVLRESLNEASDASLRRIVELLPTRASEPRAFVEARLLLRDAMGAVAEVLDAAWTDLRYTRDAEIGGEAD